MSGVTWIFAAGGLGEPLVILILILISIISYVVQWIGKLNQPGPGKAPPRPAAAGPPQILCFGRLAEEKGINLLIEAMKGVPADCLIVGDGPQKEKLQDLAARTSDARIQFLPHQPFPLLVPIIRRSAMVIIPSIWYENNPFSIIESFSLGVPVVAASIGGIPELVIDGETGMLFTAGSSAALREKIMLLLQDPELGRELARKARLHLERHFYPDLHTEKLLGLYRELIKANAKS